jgi:hypothetical protein
MFAALACKLEQYSNAAQKAARMSQFGGLGWGGIL